MTGVDSCRMPREQGVSGKHDVPPRSYRRVCPNWSTFSRFGCNQFRRCRYWFGRIQPDFGMSFLLGFVISDSELNCVAVATAFIGPSPPGNPLQFNHPARTYRLRETGWPYFHSHRHSLHRSTCRQRFLDMVLARPISLRTQTLTSTGLHPQILRRSHQRQREPFPTQVPHCEPYIPRRTQHAVWQRENK